MRILLVTHRYPPDRLAGVELYTEALAAEFTASGDTVAVVARRPFPLPLKPELEREEGVGKPTVYRFTGGLLHPRNFLVHQERLERLFTIVLLETNPDIVHVNHLLEHSPRVVAIAKRLRIPVVATIHDFYFACPLAHLQKLSGDPCAGPDGGRECARTCFAGESAPERWQLRADYFRCVLGLVDRVVCGSATVALYFEQFAPRAAPIPVVPQGVSLPFRRNGSGPSTNQDACLRLAYLGSVVPHKGVHVLVDALALAGVAAELGVFGHVFDPSYAQGLEERARAIPGLRLRLHGGYRPEEIPELLRETDALVVPSQVPECFPLVPREALALGVPVLVARAGGLAEAVREGENGYSFDAANAEELAGILRRLDADRSLLERLRRGARSTPVLTLTEHVATVREIYSDVVETALRRTREEPSELEELERLHRELIENGFAAPR